MAEIPEGLAIERVWLVEADYTPEAQERRPAVRREHLTRTGRLREQGVIVEAGGLLDWSGAVLIVRAPDAASAIAILEEDVYTRSGVWTNFRARPYGRVAREGERQAG